MVNILLILTTLFMCNSLVFAGNNNTSASFLKIGAGARAAGMGDAFCGLADDAYAPYWNPAGLAQIKGSQFGATHLEWITKINQEQIGFVQQIGTKTAFGISISHLMANDFERTNQDGIFGTFDAANTLFGLSLGRQIGNRFSLGMNVKCINMYMDDAKAIAFGGDMGMLWQVSRGLRLGLNVQNMGTDVKFIEKGYPLPLNIKAGVSYSLGDSISGSGLNLNIDANKTHGLETNVHAGGEYWLAHTIALRAGIKNEITSDTHGKSKGMATGVTAGIGLRLGGIQLDYAYVPYGSLDVTHRVSLSMKQIPAAPLEPKVIPLAKVASSTQTAISLATASTTGTVSAAGTAGTVGTVSVPAAKEKPAPVAEAIVQTKDGKIILPSFDIRFDTGRALINTELYKQLEGIAEFMNRYPQIRIRIEGHTDNRAIDTQAFHSNQELSEARAKTVYWYLIQQEILAERMKTKGYADTKPIASNDTPEGQAKNRRVEIIIIEQDSK
ncbi:PorV/PorQ family protein [bacterium]|nr:PorV/PorQ family protein [bacterium]